MSVIKNLRGEAVEVINAGKCNMDCAYCYIPKTSQMNQLHSEIVKYIDSGKFIQDFKKYYGENLTFVSLWGTEPTLTLDKYTKWMPELLETFPKLEGMSFSSNFLLHPQCILDFVEAGPRDKEEPFQFRFQYSLDGPEWITDNTRRKGATKKIIENLLWFCEELAKMDLEGRKVFLNCKSTWCEDIIEMIGKDISLLEDYFNFFDKLFGEIHDRIGDYYPFIDHGPGHAPFLGFPGRYTQQHGVYWGEIHKQMFEYMRRRREDPTLFPHLTNEFSGYVGRLQKIIDFGIEYYTKPEMFSCSAGDSQFGVDHLGYIHSCHRTFYLNSDEYIQSIASGGGRGSNWDESHFHNSRISDIRKNLMVHSDNEDKCAVFEYANMTYHHFVQNRVTILAGLTKLLAKSGQISDVYYDDVVARLFAEYCASAYCCQMEYVLSCGSMSVLPVSLLRVTGNGMFEAMLEHVMLRDTRTMGTWVK